MCLPPPVFPKSLKQELIEVFFELCDVSPDIHRIFVNTHWTRSGADFVNTLCPDSSYMTEIEFLNPFVIITPRQGEFSFFHGKLLGAFADWLAEQEVLDSNGRRRVHTVPLKELGMDYFSNLTQIQWWAFVYLRKVKKGKKEELTVIGAISLSSSTVPQFTAAQAAEVAFYLNYMADIAEHTLMPRKERTVYNINAMNVQFNNPQITGGVITFNENHYYTRPDIVGIDRDFIEAISKTQAPDEQKKAVADAVVEVKSEKTDDEKQPFYETIRKFVSEHRKVLETVLKVGVSALVTHYGIKLIE